MLKKLLASALAVATVASCAYVPTALASAATTYKTATEIDYQNWLIDHPATSPDTKTEVKVQLVANFENSFQNNTVTVKVADTSAETVKAAVAESMKKAGYEADTVNATGTAVPMYRYTLGTPVQAGATNYYVMTATKEIAVEYNLLGGTIGYEHKADLKFDNVKLLGWYADGTDIKAAAITKAYTDSLQSQVKVASKAFAEWKYENGLLYPELVEITEPQKYLYKEYVVSYVTNAGNATDTELRYGLYEENNRTKVGEYYVPATASSADIVTYINNALIAASGKISAEVIKTVDGKSVTYVAKSVRFVKAATTDAPAQYTVTYAKKDAADEATIKYNLYFKEKDGDTYVESTNVTHLDNVAVATKTYTTNADEAYALMRKDGDPKTLADYLAASDPRNVNGADEVRYTYSVLNYHISQTDAENTIAVLVEPKVKTAVYSYNADGTITKTEAYLTAAQTTNNKDYGNDGIGGVAKTDVMPVTAADLGLSNTAKVGTASATFAYAKSVADFVEVTYTIDAVQATMADFQTATGAFQVEPYFCRENAYVGDKVMLKVALTDAGKAKELDIEKVTVKYEVVGCTAGENYHFTPAEGDTRPEGIATDITLAEGTNIAIANVYYDGALIGTFAPFYTVAVAK